MNVSGEPALERVGVPWTFGDLLVGIAAGIGLAMVLLTAIVSSGLGEALDAISFLVLFGGSLYASFALALWYFAIRRRGATLAAAGFVPVRLGTLALMPVVAFGALLLNGAIVVTLRRLIGDVPDVRDQVLLEEAGSLAGADILLLLVIGAVVAPFAEEFLFRGLIFRYLRARWSFAGSATVSAAVFAVVHLSPRLIPSFFALGFILAAVTERYRTLYPAIAVHALNNALALAALYAGMA